MDAGLPTAIRDALDRLSEGVSGRHLAERAEAISSHYRSGGGSGPVIQTADDALAYALTRAPATYAAVMGALSALQLRAPAFQPRTVADIGCGPGTAGWAAGTLFGPVERLTMIDANPRLLDLARACAPDAAAVEVVAGDMRRTEPPPSDLVLAAYTLTELPTDEAVATAERAWTAATGALVVVEPGTPAGWARLMTVRARLIDLGATIAAPCPHHSPCPVAAPDWCHFVQRLPRLKAHRLLKGADAPFEDEKFNYLAAVRPSVELRPAADRILAPPTEDKAAVGLKLCTTKGALEARRVAKRDKAAYRAIRRLGWGDALYDDGEDAGAP